MTIEHYASLALAYFLGSIPFGVLIARAKGIDIMNVGSGNSGATNVYRTLGRGPGLAVFVLDVLKGLVPSSLAVVYFHDRSFAFGVGMVAVAGHSFSPWLKFKGGKGVATGLGALIGSTPIVAVSALGLFAAILLGTRFLSLASIAAAISLPVFAFVFGEPWALKIGCGVLGFFVLVRHIPNIQRLLGGTEPKFDFRGGSGTATSGQSSGINPRGVDG